MSLIICQITRVISSPSSSTTGPLTLILAGDESKTNKMKEKRSRQIHAHVLWIIKFQRHARKNKALFFKIKQRCKYPYIYDVVEAMLNKMVVLNGESPIWKAEKMVKILQTTTSSLPFKIGGRQSVDFAFSSRWEAAEPSLRAQLWSITGPCEWRLGVWLSVDYSHNIQPIFQYWLSIPR